MERECILYAGSYADIKDPGIHAFCIARDAEGTQVKTEEVFQSAGVSNPSYLTVSKDGSMIYAVQETSVYDGKEGGGIAAFKKQRNSLTLLNTMGTRGTSPCHLLLDEKKRFLYTANYSSGSVSMFRLGDDGSIQELCDFKQHSGQGKNPKRQEGPHVHFIGHSSDERGIWCVDLGLDTIFYYEVDAKHAKLIPEGQRDIHLPEGTGPRHFVLAGCRKEYMYVVCELSSEVYVFDCSAKKPQIIQSISTLDGCKTENTCAAIHLSEDGKYLYASNRGDDSIAVFSVEENHLLKLVEITKTEGRNPRDFWIGDKLLLAANQDSNSITVFRTDLSTGRITYTGKSISCSKPVCLVSGRN